MAKIKNCNIFMICILVCQIGFSFCLTWFKIPVNAVLIFLNELINPGILIILFFVFTKESPKRVFQFKPVSIHNILFIITLAVLFSPVASNISAITYFLFPNQSFHAALDDFSGYPVWFSFTVVAIIPSIVEELGFRGIVLYSFRNSGLQTAAIITGLYFGFFHLNFNQFFYAAVLGYIMVYAAWYTGSIIAPMLFHFTNNSFNLIFIYINNAQSGAPRQPSVYVSDLPALAVNMAVYILIFWLVFRQFAKYNQKRNAGAIAANARGSAAIAVKKQKAVTPAFFIILGVFIAFSALIQIRSNP